MVAPVVIAIGGNSLIQKGEVGTTVEQEINAENTALSIAELIKEKDLPVVITHGNGPQVGNALLRVEYSKHQVPALSLDYCVSQTQGSIGFTLLLAFQRAFKKLNISRNIVCIVTRVLIDPEDPSFENPTKPIGPFYSKKEADTLIKTKNWQMVEDAGRGFRRVVPSPKPLSILEAQTIKSLANLGYVVICCGGGGIPVSMKNNETLYGIEAVIDKDRTSSLLATQIGAEVFMISTGVDYVFLNYGKNDQKPITKIHLEEIKRLYKDSQFPSGSMGPKVEASIEFLEKGGHRTVITSPELLKSAYFEMNGTQIYP